MTGMNIIGLHSIHIDFSLRQHFGSILFSILAMIFATALVSKQAFTLRNKQPEHPLRIHIIAMFVGSSLVGSYLLGIHAFAFNANPAIPHKNTGTNIYAFQVLLICAFAAMILWGGILFSRWQANEGVKIASRIAGLAFGLVLLTAGTIGAVAFISSKEELTQQQLNSRLNKLELKATQLQRITDGLLQDALVLARTPPVLGILRAQKNKGIDKQDGSTEKILRERLRAIFNGFLLSKPAYLRACYIGIKNNAHEIVSVTRSGNTLLQNSGKPLWKEVRQAIISRAKEKNNYQAFLTSIKRDDAEQQAILHASVPIRDALGELFGIIVIDLDFSSVLNSTLQKINSENYVINPKGDIIFRRGTEKTLVTETSRNIRIQDIYPIMGSIINNPEKVTGNILLNGNHGTLYLNYRKIRLDPEQEEYFLRITSTPYQKHF